MTFTLNYASISMMLLALMHLLQSLIHYIGDTPKSDVIYIPKFFALSYVFYHIFTLHYAKKSILDLVICMQIELLRVLILLNR